MEINSGKDVLNAATVKPIKKLLSFIFWASAEAWSTKTSADFIKKNKLMIIIIYINVIIFIYIQKMLRLFNYQLHF